MLTFNPNCAKNHIHSKPSATPEFLHIHPTRRAKNIPQKNDLEVMNSWTFCQGSGVSRIDWDKTTLSSASFPLIQKTNKRLAVDEERCPLFSCQWCYVPEYYLVSIKAE
ncbi:hypothetical protein TNCV_5123331 [Trichonephila clavipes]|nr:hypothetical protein TNCV_5123331 [Trichonephila clavipes]